MPEGEAEALWHASCVAVGERGLLILGPSGVGKSALALKLMALGAQLVADDQVLLRRDEADVVARCPPQIRGLIEARGMGLLRATARDAVPVALVVDLGRQEDHRLPPRHHIAVLGVTLDLVLAVQADHFPYALLQYLRDGRQA